LKKVCRIKSTSVNLLTKKGFIEVKEDLKTSLSKNLYSEVF